METRGWSTAHRGLIAIHAAKKYATWQRELTEAGPFSEGLVLAGVTYSRRYRPGAQYAHRFDLPFGAVIAVARLVDVLPTEHLRDQLHMTGQLGRWTGQERMMGDYGPGRFAWLLEDVKALSAPVPCRGRQRLFVLPPDITADVLQRVALRE